MNSAQTFRTSVVICTINRPDDIRECLTSLAAQTHRPDEVIVVDDGDYQQTASTVANADLESITHVEGSGRGVPASRNRGIDEATGDVVCFVDDDVVLPSNWLAEILAVYRERDPDGVGGLVVNYNPDGVGKADLKRLSYRIITAVRYLLFYDRVGELGPGGVMYAPLTLNTTGIKRVDVLQGCNMSFRAELFETHTFDEWYGEDGAAPAEELEFCTRVVRDGGELVFTPRAVAVHKRTIPGGERPGSQSHFRNFRNLALYCAEQSSHRNLNLVLLLAHALLSSVFARNARPLRRYREGLREFRSRTE